MMLQTPNPDQLPAGPVRDAVSRLRQLAADRDKCGSEIGQLETRRDTAANERAIDIAQCLFEGKPTPEDDPTAKLDAALAALRARYAGYDRAVEMQEDAVRAAVLDNRDQTLAALSPLLANATADYLSAIDKLAAARAKRQEPASVAS